MTSRRSTASKSQRTRRRRASAAPPGKAPRAGAPCLVIGYDGSREARHAAAWAARRADAGTRLVLIHAIRPRRRWLPLELLRSGSERRGRGRALIDELIMDGDEALLEVQLEAHVVDDTPAHALIDAAQRHGAREIIVGSHHPTRSDTLYGDVAAELVRSAPVPVVVVPLGEQPSGTEAGGS